MLIIIFGFILASFTLVSQAFADSAPVEHTKNEPVKPPFRAIHPSLMSRSDIAEILKRDHAPEHPPLRVVLEPVHRTIYFPQPQVISPVVQLNVKAGDSFKKGDLLLQLDSDKYRAFYDRFTVNVEKAQVELRTKEKLYNDGTVSYFEYIEAKSRLADAVADAVLAEKNLEATEIIAPYNGKVASLSIELNELPVEAKEMIELIEDDALIGKILIPSSLIDQIKVGDTLEIYIEEKKKKIQTKVSRIAAVIDPASSTLKVEVIIDNRKGELKPGMSGFAVLNMKKH